MSDDCIFCKILSGEAPCYPVHETRYTKTFLDIFPADPGHCLIVTKEHFTDIFEATPEAVGMVGHVSTLIAHTLREELGCDGVGIYQLNGDSAGQSVFHYHMHVIPRWKSTELNIHSRVPGDPAELEALAQRLHERAYSMRIDD
ncbi:HIT family protein [Halioglobus japonicus]|uniref:HIT family protein n=1 Tax=Halioglobus japonicus TaxID=930805 RepID=A0AAP8MFH8_9GAMM|nr:HIT family protein [Halioglobus japonicus]AQA18867.1 HIT family protein [Halioglobus japonicus]PLW86905.1 HIT family protein [Halioglobus japonicus]GHD23440.1 hydrolase [Halioglobus japonicus]